MGIIKNAITFGSGFNITAEGPIDSRMVVEKISDLTTVWNSNAPEYKGMVVSVIEDGNMYVLKEKDFTKLDNWKKIGSDVDIDIEEIKTSAKQLSSPINVAGLSGNLGENISNDKTYTNLEEIIRDLLEIYPSVSLNTVNPTISFDGIIDDVASNYNSIMEVGSVLNLNPVTLGVATISSGYRSSEGFTYGYSSANDNSKDDDGNPTKIDSVYVSLDGTYSLTETYSPSSIGTPRTVPSSDNCNEVKFDAGSVTVALGKNDIKITATSPSGKYTHPEYQEYYIVSNLGNTSEDKKLSKKDSINGTIESQTSESTISITGVYPVYVNINSDGDFVDETIKMPLITSNVIEFEVPSEVEYGKCFTFDYPATHSILSFELKDLSKEYVPFDADYDGELEIPPKIVGDGVEVSYKRLKTNGSQGKGIYKITLSKRLDK